MWSGLGTLGTCCGFHYGSRSAARYQSSSPSVGSSRGPATGGSRLLDWCSTKNPPPTPSFPGEHCLWMPEFTLGSTVAPHKGDRQQCCCVHTRQAHTTEGRGELWVWVLYRQRDRRPDGRLHSPGHNRQSPRTPSSSSSTGTQSTRSGTWPPHGWGRRSSCGRGAGPGSWPRAAGAQSLCIREAADRETDGQSVRQTKTGCWGQQQ